MRRLVSKWALLLTLVPMGCATGGAVPVGGRHIEVTPSHDADGHKVEGELLAVDEETIWVLGKERIVAVPLATVRQVEVRRHSATPGRVARWSALGAALTGGALALACNSVDGNSDCGKIFLSVGFTWALGGAIAAVTLGPSKMGIDEPWAQSLRPYARFPQGPPKGVELPAPQGPPR
jgi:hypothetical protein